MTIFAYMRFSSENQTNNTSIQTQREAIERFVKGCKDFQNVDCRITDMIDEAKTATTLRGRIALKTMRQQAVRGDAVVVYKLDRLGRNLQDSLQVISDFENNGIRVYSTCEPEVPLVRHILLAVAEDFSRALGDRCRGALHSLASAGFATNKSPYGYRIKREPGGRGGKFVQIPEQAAVVLRIFQMRGDGRSHREIARALNGEAVPGPRGVDWNIATISHILKNEAYLGTIICGDRKFKKRGMGYRGGARALNGRLLKRLTKRSSLTNSGRRCAGVMRPSAKTPRSGHVPSTF